MLNNFQITANTYDEPIFGISFYNTSTTTSFFLNINTRYNFVVPIALNWTSNAILQSMRGTNASNISIAIQPLVKSNLELKNNTDNSMLVISFLIIGLSLIASSSILFIVREREMGSKHQQFVAGISLRS